MDRPLHGRKPDKIVEEALKTMGLDFDDLGKIAQVNGSYIRERLASKDLAVSELWAVFEAVYLQVDCYSWGYFRQAHEVSIFNAVVDGYYRYPKRPAYWRLLFGFLKRFVVNWRFQGGHYGFRLRWRVRRQDSMRLIRRIFARSYSSRDPQSFLKKAFLVEPQPKSVVKRPKLRIASAKEPMPLLEKLGDFDLKSPC